MWNFCWKLKSNLGPLLQQCESKNKPEVHPLPSVEARVLHPQLGDGVPGEGEGVAGVDVLLSEGVNVALGYQSHVMSIKYE